MIELDVKVTDDDPKVPILSHDRTWGRSWCGLSGLPFGGRIYDPFTPPGDSTNDSSNPSVAATKLTDTRSLLGHTWLRDSVSLVNDFYNGCEPLKNFYGEYPPTLSDALDYIAKNKIRMVVLLDIQSVEIAQAAYAVVASKNDDAGRPFLNSTIFKMPMSLFPGGYGNFVSVFGDNFKTMHFIPVINTSDVSPTNAVITDTEDGGFDLSNVGTTGFGSEAGIISTLNSMETGTQFGPILLDAVEVNYKEPNGILTQVLAAARTNQRTQGPMTVGFFNPVGEYYPNNDTSQTPQFFRSSNGTCCDVLTQYLYNNPNGTGPIDPTQPRDTSDQRTNLSFVNSNNFQYIITDDPRTERNVLVGSGKRNICYMQPTPLSNCNSGGINPQLQLLSPTFTVNEINGNFALTSFAPPPTQTGVAAPASYSIIQLLQGTNGTFSCIASGFSGSSLSALASLSASAGPAGVDILEMAIVANYAAGFENQPYSATSDLWNNPAPSGYTPTRAVAPNSSTTCTALPAQ